MSYLFGAAGVLVSEFVIPPAGRLVANPFVSGIIAEAALVDAGGGDELFPQPIPASMVIPKLMASKCLQILIVLSFPFLTDVPFQHAAHRCRISRTRASRGLRRPKVCQRLLPLPKVGPLWFFARKLRRTVHFARSGGL
jgi:hypothetical protein